MTSSEVLSLHDKLSWMMSSHADAEYNALRDNGDPELVKSDVTVSN